MAPAKTGRAKSNRRVVIKILQENKVINSNFKDKLFILVIVTIKFKDLIMEEIPAKCKDKIVKSTEFPE